MRDVHDAVTAARAASEPTRGDDASGAAGASGGDGGVAGVPVRGDGDAVATGPGGAGAGVAGAAGASGAEGGAVGGAGRGGDAAPASVPGGDGGVAGAPVRGGGDAVASGPGGTSAGAPAPPSGPGDGGGADVSTPGGSAAGADVWPGTWVAGALDVRLGGDPALRGLLGLALRDNPKRAHLLVSNVLGKHVPQSPAVVRDTGLRLGERVRALLGPAAADAVVLGYAETATGLGHCVADGVRDAPYLHSTRRPVPGVERAGGFEESHSHATSHLLLPEDPALLAGDGPLVLVDDEFSTGNTVLNTIRALHERRPRARYVIVAIVDMRSDGDRGRLAAFAGEIGARVDLVTLASGTVRLPDGVLERGTALVRAHEEAQTPPRAALAAAPAPGPAAVTRVRLDWPGRLPDGGRHGFLPVHRDALDAAVPAMASAVAAALPPGARRVLVLGFEELMYTPLRLAQELERTAPPGTEVRYSTTTRSPVLAVDDPGYAIRSRLAFPAHDTAAFPEGAADGAGVRYAYNVAGAGFDAVVLVVDSAGDSPELCAPGGLLAQLAAHAGPVVLAVVPTYVPPGAAQRLATGGRRPHPPERQDTTMLPEPLRGPAFSSYAPDEVGWLLQDLSDVELEAPTEEREEAIQSGGAHYAESLPVEYQPNAAYQELFRAALDTSAARIARAVGAVTETVLAERSPRPVLVSLARAGTPVGVLMRRWAAHHHGVELPHYAVSIVRGRGIDTTAMRWLAAHHDPADVVFVDGWTGKGAITRELAAAIGDFEGFDPEIAVLADPGGCVRTYGTREDFLIPSACLNSTVSGLVSRTVLRADLVGPDDFHGAKFYRELAGADVSGLFADAVSARFDEVADAVGADVKELLASDRSPTWAGWAAVERISEEYGIHDVNLVKPGVGETTRVLLRRVPWRILARRGAGADLDHVTMLAGQRGVPVEEVDELPYSCVGLIHPRYTRGATGADGTAVSPGAAEPGSAGAAS